MQKRSLLILFLLVAVLKANHQVIRFLDEHLNNSSRVRQSLLTGTNIQLLDMLLQLLLDLFERVKKDVLISTEFLVLLQDEEVVDLSA